MKTSQNNINRINNDVNSNNKNYLLKNSTIEIITTDRKSENNNDLCFNKKYRKDAFGNIIYKNNKSYHISFIDQISKKPLVEICSSDNNTLIIFDNKILSKCSVCFIF